MTHSGLSALRQVPGYRAPGRTDAAPPTRTQPPGRSPPPTQGRGAERGRSERSTAGRRPRHPGRDSSLTNPGHKKQPRVGGAESRRSPPPPGSRSGKRFRPATDPGLPRHGSPLPSPPGPSSDCRSPHPGALETSGAERRAAGARRAAPNASHGDPRPPPEPLPTPAEASPPRPGPAGSSAGPPGNPSRPKFPPLPLPPPTGTSRQLAQRVPRGRSATLLLRGAPQQRGRGRDRRHAAALVQQHLIVKRLAVRTVAAEPAYCRRAHCGERGAVR